MAKIDRNFFFEQYRKKFGNLNQTQVDNLNVLIDAYDSDDRMERLTWFAYVLGTIYHECAATWKPIKEYGKGKGKQYGIPDSETGQVYYGRGWVQLTWKYNYEKASKKLGIDFVNNPDLVMEIDNATKICFTGMIEGWFTGKSLKNYFTDTKTDWVNARKIINGLDQANLIANISKKMYDCLQYIDDIPEPVGEEVTVDKSLEETETKDPVITETNNESTSIKTDSNLFDKQKCFFYRLLALMK